jgi:ABC-2 type transport system permease protein
MYALIFKKFIRGRAAIVGLAFILIAGIISLAIGKRFLTQQELAIEQSQKFQQEFIGNYAQYIPNDMGLLLYYLRFSLANKPVPLSGVSIGQRDVNPSVQSVTIRNLENQKWDTDLINPSNLLLGNMDLGFVMIYLFPLLIIAFTYNILSEEKEGSTWDLVRLHAALPVKILWQKLGVRMVVVYGAAAVLMILAVLMLSLPLNLALLAVILFLALYLLFWFGLSFLAVSLKKDSSFNAVSMLALWVLLTILAPALVNSYINNAYPVPEALKTVVKQRQGYHEKWDMDKKVTMDKFYAHYPQYQKYPLPDKPFSWLWYYAMHQMGDDESVKESKELENKLWKRHNVSNRIAMVFPPLHAQLTLNNLAQSDLQNHLQFLDSTKKFHEKRRLFFYEKIFDDQPVNSVDWKNLRLEYFTATTDIKWLPMLLPLLFISGVLFWAAQRNFYKPEIDEV